MIVTSRTKDASTWSGWELVLLGERYFYCASRRQTRSASTSRILFSYARGLQHTSKLEESNVVVNFCFLVKSGSAKYWWANSYPFSNDELIGRTPTPITRLQFRTRKKSFWKCGSWNSFLKITTFFNCLNAIRITLFLSSLTFWCSKSQTKISVFNNAQLRQQTHFTFEPQVWAWPLVEACPRK